jgi:hypothetical protein
MQEGRGYLFVQTQRLGAEGKGRKILYLSNFFF